MIENKLFSLKWGKFIFLKALIVVTNVAVKCIGALKVIKMRAALDRIVILKAFGK